LNGITFITQAELDARFTAEHAHEDFWCEICGRTHPLIEHRECRKPHHERN